MIPVKRRTKQEKASDKKGVHWAKSKSGPIDTPEFIIVPNYVAD
jgi:hypothetical protein